MPRSNRFWLRAVILLAALSITRPAHALIYRGLEHAPSGKTQLAVSDTLLLVSGLSSTGLDGLSIDLPPGCVNFAALFDSIRLEPGGAFTASFMSEATLSAYATVQRLPNDSTQFVAGFEGVTDTSSIRLTAYLGGAVVRSIIVQPQVAPAPFSSMTAGRNRTNIIPFLILGGVVLGILSDVREVHVTLPSDPPGFYSKETHYTFVGYGLAHPADGHLPGDNVNISFDQLVVSPVRKYNDGMSLTLARLGGHDVEAFKIGQEFVETTVATTPGIGGIGLVAGSGLLAMAAIARLLRRSRSRDKRQTDLPA